MHVIEIPHKVLDYSCPINGLEDQYEWKTGVRLPGFSLMDLATIGFTYIKQKNASAPRMIFWGSGMGKPLIAFLSEIIGFDWFCLEDKSFKTAWQTAVENVASGTPVMLGLLDMYHLHYYPKFYHRVHIPQHYVLLVGIDEEEQAALVQDNGLPGIQSIPLSDLQQAWNVRVPGQGKPNTLFTFQFHEQLADPETIWRKCLQKRAQSYLNPPVGFIGVKGARKAGREINQWKNELTQAQWQASLRSLATFTCSVVPNLPQALLPFPLGYNDPHQACRDRFAMELSEAAITYGESRWTQAAQQFKQSGKTIGLLTQVTVQALNSNPKAFEKAGELLSEITKLEEAAFKLLL